MFWVAGTVKLGVTRTAVEVIVVVINVRRIEEIHRVERVFLPAINGKFGNMLVLCWLSGFIHHNTRSRDRYGYSDLR